jgi:hypothetical protein
VSKNAGIALALSIVEYAANIGGKEVLISKVTYILFLATMFIFYLLSCKNYQLDALTKHALLESIDNFLSEPLLK